MAKTDRRKRFERVIKGKQQRNTEKQRRNNIPPRLYSAGLDIGKWRKGERVRHYTDVRSGDILILDSHQFEATNLIRVCEIIHSPGGAFTYVYARPDGSGMGDAPMLAHNFELNRPERSFYRASR